MRKSLHKKHASRPRHDSKDLRQWAWKFGPSNRKPNDNQVLTNQYDTKLVYKRKRGGKGKSKQQKFAKKVRQALIQSLGKNRVQKISHGQLISSAGQQNQFTFALYGGYGAANFEDDLQQIMVGAFSATGTLSTNQRLMLSGAVLDVYFTNPSANTPSAFVEVYVIVPKKDMPLNFSGTTLTTLDGFWGQTLSNQPAVLNYTGMEATTVNSGSVSLIQGSPFDSTGFCQYMTILEKRVFLLAPGQMGTIQVKQNRHGVVKTEDIQGIYSLKRWTKYVLINAWGMNTATTTNSTNATNFPAITLNVTGNRSYQFEVLNDQEDAAILFQIRLNKVYCLLCQF